MKIGLIGSMHYENKKKIKETVFMLKQKFGNDLIIVGGGDNQNGADKYAKKFIFIYAKRMVWKALFYKKFPCTKQDTFKLG